MKAWHAGLVSLALLGCSSGAIERPIPKDCPSTARATIRGVVLTELSKPISGAKVTLPGYDSNMIYDVDETGFFEFACVVPGGGYEVLVAAEGYEPARLDWVEAREPVTDLIVRLRKLP